MATIWCAHAESWLDASLCPEPCGALHRRCVRCGHALGYCPFEDGWLHERLVVAIRDALPGRDDLVAREVAETWEKGRIFRHDLSLDKARTIALARLARPEPQVPRPRPAPRAPAPDGPE
jgi:hypothetical protein